MNIPDNRPKSILKKNVFKPSRKRLFSKLNSLIFTNGIDHLSEEQIMIFIPRPYQLVPWRGVEFNKLHISDNIMFDIGAESINLPAVCEFLVINNGAARVNCDIAPQLVVRDAISQINTQINTKSIDLSFPQRQQQPKQICIEIDQSIQTDLTKNTDLTPKPTEDKCVTTDDILDSLPDLKNFSIKDLMSTFSLEGYKSQSNLPNVLNSSKRYRGPWIKNTDTLNKYALIGNEGALDATKNLINDEHDQNVEEYEVNDFLCDTEDLTRYFNFDCYTFGQLLSGKIRVQVVPKSDDMFKLIDIKVKGPGCGKSDVGTLTDDSLNKKSNLNKITQTERKIEEKKQPSRFEIKSMPVTIKLCRKTHGLNDIIDSMDKKMEAFNQIAASSKNQFDCMKKDRRVSQLSVSSYNSSHNEKLESHIEKYYNTSRLRYPLIAKAMDKKPKQTSVANSESWCSFRHDSSPVDYLGDLKTCPICSRRRKESARSANKERSPFASFDNLVKKSGDLAQTKNFSNEYLVDNSFVFDCESELFDTSRYIRTKHDKSLSMYANDDKSCKLKD